MNAITCYARSSISTAVETSLRKVPPFDNEHENQRVSRTLDGGVERL